MLPCFHHEVGRDRLIQRFLVFRRAMVGQGVIDAEGQRATAASQPPENGLGLADLILCEAGGDGA